MAKQGMKRPEPEWKKNTLPPVPEVDDLARENLMEDFDLNETDVRDFWRKW